MRILTAACISEGLLAILAVIGHLAFDLSAKWEPNPVALCSGIFLTLPALTVNHLLSLHAARTPESIYRRFSDEVIIPLCRRISVPIAILIAVLSGICEEWFFRGTLNMLCFKYLGPIGSCLVTSLLFASVHFIGSFKRYGGMLPLYTAMGVYLWLAHYLTQSLAAVAVLHGLYNFTVMLLVKRANARTSTQTSFGQL